jgi:Flp pilus assembly pilin Flp
VKTEMSAKTGIQKIRNHMSAVSRNEDGMEAAQVILILVLVVLGLIPVIMTITNSLKSKGTEINNGITGITP